MINYENVAEKIFAIIKGHGFNLSMFTQDGMDTSEPSEGRRFYVKEPNFMITLDEDNNEIKINKNSNVSLVELESIMTQIKNLAKINMLNTQIKVFGQKIVPKDYAYQAKKYKDKNMSDMNEASLSRMHGSKKTSYQTLESVKLIVHHRKVVDENVRGSRSRQIKAIFLEQGGERFRFPHNNLAGARAMARHMYEGGNMRDTIGEYIIESVGNIIKLSEFIRYTRTNKLINEASEDIIKIVKENIFTLRNELKRLTGIKSYNIMSETITNREECILEEDDSIDLQDIFTIHKFDEKIGDMLPLIKKLMNEKAAWRTALLEASKQQIFMKAKEELAEEDIMEFDNPLQQVGYKIGKIAKRMVETNDLSKFVDKVANKLIEGETISDFEKTIVRNVMENAKIEEEKDKCEECDCSPCVCDENNDMLENIGNQFDLKMKMIEHEDIFGEAELKKRGELGRGVKEADYDDHHAGEIEAGAHSGMPSADNNECPSCNGWGLDNDGLDGICETCHGTGIVNDLYGQDPEKVICQQSGLDEEDFMDEAKEGAHSGIMPASIFKVTNDGKVIGEVGIDEFASPGLAGPWYAVHFQSGIDSSGFANREEAETEVKGIDHRGLDDNYDVDVENYMVGDDIEGQIRR